MEGHSGFKMDSNSPDGEAMHDLPGAGCPARKAGDTKEQLGQDYRDTGVSHHYGHGPR